VRDGFTSEENNETEYPIRSVHNFLLDVERELDRLRTASLIGVFAIVLILISLVRFAARLIEFNRMFPHPRMGITVDGALLVLATLSLLYSAYALYGQNKFFRKWGRRFELLEGVERRLLNGKNS